MITGASSGIGRALAQRLAGHGCPVAICDADAEGLERTAETLGAVLSRELDVRDRQGQMAFAAAVSEWAPAPIGLVVNNAGVTVSQPAATAAPEDDEWVFDVNFWGVVHGTRAFLPILLEQDSGTIVNVSSVFGLIGWPTQSAYCASKFAVRGYTESLRHELRDCARRRLSRSLGGGDRGALVGEHRLGGVAAVERDHAARRVGGGAAHVEPGRRGAGREAAPPTSDRASPRPGRCCRR